MVALSIVHERTNQEEMKSIAREVFKRSLKWLGVFITSDEKVK